MTHTLITSLTFVALASHCLANEFLKATPKELQERVSEEDIQTSLLEEVEGTLGTGSAANRLRLLEAVLKPTYDALPKNEHGNLGHSVVRYALHRLFVLRHGWNIKGLGRNVEDSNITSPAGILKDHVPTYIQNIFEKRLGDKGLGLHELAVMASTLEHLIHKEAVTKLGYVYKAFKTFPTKKVSEGVANEMLDTYMMAHILGENLANLTLFDARSLNADMPQLFLGWQDTQKFVRGIRSKITNGGGASLALDFSSLAKVVKAVGEEFGTFQDRECHQLKEALTRMEFAGSGRVKLSDFYRPSVDGAWQFQESVPYLRQLGALDESDPHATSVIIVNYLHSQTNCIASAGYYSICCKDECEGLIGQLEEKIAAPEATPAVIVAIVEKMVSSSVNSSRSLSPKMLQYLDDIASLNQGVVPLHGRLFAQWMHHAYPRECPYPHKSGTTRQQTSDEWFLESGIDSLATEKEMNHFTKSSASATVEGDEGIMPWSTEEELLVCRENPIVKPASLFTRLRPIVLFALVGLLAFGVVQNLKSMTATGKKKTEEKYIV